MPDQFSLTVELGNDAMQTLDDIAAKLREIADRLESGYDTSGRIIDDNGNTVGEWGVS